MKKKVITIKPTYFYLPSEKETVELLFNVKLTKKDITLKGSRFIEIIIPEKPKHINPKRGR